MCSDLHSSQARLIAGSPEAAHPVIGKPRVLAAIVITIASNPRRPEYPNTPLCEVSSKGKNTKDQEDNTKYHVQQVGKRVVIVLTKRDQASNSVVGLD
ncbi:MAG: hypothetical protein ACJ71B_06015 [Nitrososphaera sp.]